MFSVSDKDLAAGQSLPSYRYEFTSSQFRRNTEAQLVVADSGLDRDAPSQPTLIVQVSSTVCQVPPVHV